MDMAYLLPKCLLMMRMGAVPELSERITETGWAMEGETNT